MDHIAFLKQQKIRCYKTKQTAINKLPEEWALANVDIKNYFHTESLQTFLQLIKETPTPCYYEYICKNVPVNMFFDIEIYRHKNPEEYEGYKDIIETIKKCVLDRYQTYSPKFLILESHDDSEKKKKSFHVIVRMKDPDQDQHVYFSNVEDLKGIIISMPDLTNYIKSKIVDTSVYREGLFRTIHSSKSGENRPLVVSELSDAFDDEIYTFVTYTEEPHTFVNPAIEIAVYDLDIPETSEHNEEIMKKVANDIQKEDMWKILNGLNKQRWDNREDWVKIGYVLQSYSYGEDLFLEFSKKSPSYNEERHKTDWESFESEEKKISAGTLFYWLKIDNIKLYTKLIQKNKILHELDNLVQNSDINNYSIKHTQLTKSTNKIIETLIDHQNLKPVHDAICKGCQHMHLYSKSDRAGYRICCKNCNFEFGSIQMDQSLAPTIYNTLNVVINEDINNKDTYQIAREIKQYREIIFTKEGKDGSWYVFNETNGIYERRATEYISNLITVIRDEQNSDENEWHNWINKVSYRNMLVSELKTQCIKEIGIDIEFDSHEHLLGFPNGVLDLNTFEFRPGHKDEYTTMKCGVSYDPDFDCTLAQSYLNDVFPIEEEREYALNRFSLALYGENKEQTFTLNYGFSASNGKSFLMENLDDMFGDYGDSFPSSLLTSKMKDAGDANSTLKGFMGKRFMYASEPEAGRKANANLIKQLTADRIKTRGNYDVSDTKINPTYSIFVNCNALLNFDTYDEGLRRRPRIIEFKSRFVDKPRKKLDKQLKKYSKEERTCIQSGIMIILINHFKRLKETDFKYSEPKQLMSIRKMYLNDNRDKVKDALMEEYELGTKFDFVSLKDIKMLFQEKELGEKDIITITKYVHDVFQNDDETLEFCEKTKIKQVDVRNVFKGLIKKRLIEFDDDV
jgi:P4 family phage/plasmid primase-like protien